MKLTKKILAALVLAFALGSAGCGAQNGGETAAKETTPQEAAAEGTSAMEVAAEEAEAASQARMAADGGEAAEADQGSAEGAEDAGGKNGKHRVAADDETVAPSQVVEEGMEPVYACVGDLNRYHELCRCPAGGNVSGSGGFQLQHVSDYRMYAYGKGRRDDGAYDHERRRVYPALPGNGRGSRGGRDDSGS